MKEDRREMDETAIKLLGEALKGAQNGDVADGMSLLARFMLMENQKRSEIAAKERNYNERLP